MTIKIVRRRLKNGTIKEYRYGEPEARTIGALIIEFQQSSEYRLLKPATKETYKQGISRIAAFENVPIVEIRRRHILGHRDKFADTPASANKVVVTWSRLMSFALDREYIEASPTRGVRRLPIGEHGRWSDEAVDFALSHLREPIRRAILIGLHTGQRLGDCAAMRWSDYDGAGIAVRQEKTDEPLWIPAHESLKRELNAWPKTSTHILTNKYGRPWTRGAFAHAVSHAFRAHPELNGCVFHGLRKTAAARLAEAGCPPHHIAAITGHKSLAMLMHYTKEAQQKGMAKAAISRLENFRKTGKRQPSNELKNKEKI